jgi:phage RecT family recombinase
MSVEGSLVVSKLNTPTIRSQFSSSRAVETLKFKAELQYLQQIIDSNEKVRICTPESFNNILLDVAFSGLSLRPSLGHAYVVPYGTKATFSPGYRGMLWLAFRTGALKSVTASFVVAADPVFKVWTDENGKHIAHEETRAQRDVRELTHAYCIAKFANGETQIEVMNATDIANVERQAKAKGGGAVWNGPWRHEMVIKAVIRRAWKKWPDDDAGHLANAIAMADKYEPIEFDPEPPPPPEYVVISDDQKLELHAFLTDRGLESKEADVWLHRYAESRGFSSISVLPADGVDAAKSSLQTRLKKVLKAREASNG